MKINFGNWVFCPKLITSICAVIFFILFLNLGFWQLERAEQKRELQSFFNERQAKEIIDLNNSFIWDYVWIVNSESNGWFKDNDNILWRKVTATGNFLERRQILLDNQVNAGQAGYYVYTPFKVKNSEDIFLVNRGWVPIGGDRNKSPNLILTEGEATIHGVFKKEPRTGVLLIENQVEKLNANVTRFQKIDIDEISAVTKIKLFSYIIRLSPESEHGYIRNWKLRNSGENVHIGYAYQWFAFAATLFIIYFVMNLKKKVKENG